MAEGGGSGTPIGALAVRIGADANQLISELDRSRAALNSTAKVFEVVGKAATVFAETAVAVAGSLAFVTKTAIDNADAMYKASQSAGVATSTFTELAYAAQLSGVNSEALGVSLSRLNRGIVEAASRTGNAYAALQALGLSAKDARGNIKSVDEVIDEVADKFSKAKDSAEKTAIAIALFGRAGAQMVPMLNQGARGLKETREEARLLGVSFDSEAGQAAEHFNDDLKRLAAVNQGYANDLMHALLPALNQVTEEWVRSKKESGGFHEQIVALAGFIQDTGLAAFQVLAMVGANISFMFKTAGNELGGMAAQVVALAHLDFEGFSAIGESMQENAQKARDELDALEKKIMSMKLVKPTQPGGGMDMLGSMPPKNALPVLVDPAVAKRREEEIREIMHKVREQQDDIDFKQQEFQNKRLEELLQYQLNARIEISEKIARYNMNPTMDDTGFSPEHDAKYVQLRNSLKSYEQLENDYYQKRLSDLMTFTDDELAVYGGRQALQEQLEREHDDRMVKTRSKSLNTLEEFNKASWDAQARHMIGSLQEMTAGSASSNRQMFEINKIASEANAIVKGWEAVQSSYAFGAELGGPYVGAAFAAVAAAATLANVAAIEKTQFGGGGIAPSAAATPAPPVSPIGGGSNNSTTNAGGPDTIIHLHGDSFDRKALRNLISSLNEGGRDGGRIVLADA